MARLVYNKAVVEKDKECLADLRRIVRKPNFMPRNFQEIISEIFVTCYLGTKNSSRDTLDRADRVAKGIGAHHFPVTIDDTYKEVIELFKRSTGKTPRFCSQGGTYTEDLAL